MEQKHQTLLIIDGIINLVLLWSIAVVVILVGVVELITTSWRE